MQKAAAGKRNRTWLWALAVLAAAAGAIFLVGGEREPAAPREGAEAAPEPEPLAPHGHLVEASWLAGTDAEAYAAAEPDPEDPWKDFVGERRKRYEESVEAALDPLGGLGVYVAPLETAEESGR